LFAHNSKTTGTIAETQTVLESARREEGIFADHFFLCSFFDFFERYFKMGFFMISCIYIVFGVDAGLGLGVVVVPGG
jgi:hypothetical protein